MGGQTAPRNVVVGETRASAASSEASIDAAPRITVVIAAHNRAKYLHAALESALTQTVAGGIEILVVDDASTDATPEVIAEFARREPSVRGLRVASGRPSGTRNAGIRAARGEFIAFLDDDDLYLRPWFAEALARFDHSDDANLAMVYGQVQPVDDDLKPILLPFPALPLAEGHPVGALLRTAIHLNAVMLRRSALDAVGLFDESLFGAEDKDLSVRVARRFRVMALTGGALAIVRMHATGRAGRATKLRERWNDDKEVLVRHWAVADEHRPAKREQLTVLMRLRGWYMSLLVSQALADFAHGDTREARKALRFAFAMSPLHAAKDRAFWALCGKTLRG